MIYFLLCRATKSSQFVKIGYSKHPEKRIKEIQGMCPLKLDLICTFKGDLETEKTLHLYYKDKRIPYTNEWFKNKGELKESIKRFKDNGTNPKSIQDFIFSGGSNRSKQRLQSLFPEVYKEYFDKKC